MLDKMARDHYSEMLHERTLLFLEEEEKRVLRCVDTAPFDIQIGLVERLEMIGSEIRHRDRPRAKREFLRRIAC